MQKLSDETEALRVVNNSIMSAQKQVLKLETLLEERAQQLTDEKKHRGEEVDGLNADVKELMEQIALLQSEQDRDAES